MYQCSGRIHRAAPGGRFSGGRYVSVFIVAFNGRLVGMMDIFTAYIKTITALTIFSALAGMLLPEGKYRRYAELVLGIMVLEAVLEPLLGLLLT